MSSPNFAVKNDSRLRAYVQFVAALCYFILAKMLVRHAALGLSNGGLIGVPWEPLVEQAMLVFLLLLGYSGMGFSLNQQAEPVSAQGLPLRKGWLGEAGMGVAFGWGIAVVCVAVMAVVGGIVVRFTSGAGAWEWLAIDGLYFLLLSLVEEIAFRGYGFQRLSRSLGSSVALLGYGLLYAAIAALQPAANHAAIFVAFLLNTLLTLAYLRTRALWVSWGLNFGWKASRALLFGLTISGNSIHSPLVEGDPMGGFWLTGGGYGLDGSWFAFLILLAALPVLYKLTRDLDFHHNAPDIQPGGIPVDIDAAARKQHEAAMGQAAPAEPALVQIAPLAAAAPVAQAEARPESPGGAANPSPEN
jgi:uncharacterized protein